MVLKGRGKFPEKKRPEIPPPTPNINKIASLQKQDASDKALELLHEVATLVSPIIELYNFKVGLLCEMYPKQSGLLGLNVNRGQKICLRLRSPTDPKWFLDRDAIVGTMLHELTHNLYGRHDAKFYKQLDELKDKYMEQQIQMSLKTSSYKNNFSAPLVSKVNNIKRQYTTRVSKLGTNIEGRCAKNLSLAAMRELMLKAAERRAADAVSCAEVDTEKLLCVPKDDELHIIDVISLDSDSEDEESSAKKSETNIKVERKPVMDVIILD